MSPAKRDEMEGPDSRFMVEVVVSFLLPAHCVFFSNKVLLHVDLLQKTKMCIICIYIYTHK